MKYQRKILNCFLWDHDDAHEESYVGAVDRFTRPHPINKYEFLFFRRQQQRGHMDERQT